MNIKKFLVLGLLACSVLYGTSYQQFRHFNVANPVGASDSLEYISMSHGDFNISPVARYRFVIPVLAGGLEKLLLPHMGDSNEATKLSFYAVNFAFLLIAGLAFCYFLEALGFPVIVSILGMGLFYSSRITILSAGTPLVDSYFFAALSMILLLLQTRKYRLLWLLNPVFALSKETIFPFMLLGLLHRENRKIPMILSLIASFVVVYISRSYVGKLAMDQQNSEDDSLFSVLITHVRTLGENTSDLFTLGGLHDLQNGFSFLLILAVLGVLVNFRFKLMKLPFWLWLTLPVAFGFSLLSGNLGRMFFASYGIVIPLALIFLSWSVKQWGSEEGAKHFTPEKEPALPAQAVEAKKGIE